MGIPDKNKLEAATLVSPRCLSAFLCNRFMAMTRWYSSLSSLLRFLMELGGPGYVYSVPSGTRIAAPLHVVLRSAATCLTGNIG